MTRTEQRGSGWHEKQWQSVSKQGLRCGVFVPLAAVVRRCVSSSVSLELSFFGGGGGLLRFEPIKLLGRTHTQGEEKRTRQTKAHECGASLEAPARHSYPSGRGTYLTCVVCVVVRGVFVQCMCSGCACGRMRGASLSRLSTDGRTDGVLLRPAVLVIFA